MVKILFSKSAQKMVYFQKKITLFFSTSRGVLTQNWKFPFFLTLTHFSIKISQLTGIFNLAIVAFYLVPPVNHNFSSLTELVWLTD